jgi:hypothetical protein
MLGIGIKNAILFILIILIFHFVIKNMLIDRTNTSTYASSIKNTIITQESPLGIQATKENFQAASCPDYPKPPEFNEDSSKSKCLPNTDSASSDKDNLMKFVFGDDTVAKDSKDLDVFFPKDAASCDKPYNECKLKDDNHTPLPSSCSIDFQLPAPTDAKKKEICNTKKQLMIVNEYENEKPENGGTLFGGISAFDNYDLNFQQYACESKN